MQVIIYNCDQHAFGHLTQEVRSLQRSLNALRKEVRVAKSTPGPFQAITVLEETDMGLRTNVVLPKLPEDPVKLADIDKKELTVRVPGKPDDVLPLFDQQATDAEYTVQKRDVVTLSMVYIDDEGNRSLPLEQTYTAVGNIAPDVPGPFGAVTVLEETP